METKTTTFDRLTHEEVREMFRRAKARQHQLEEEARRMWEEEQRIKAENQKIQTSCSICAAQQVNSRHKEHVFSLIGLTRQVNKNAILSQIL